jgi:hypothetical protein
MKSFDLIKDSFSTRKERKDLGFLALQFTGVAFLGPALGKQTPSQ